MSLPDMTGDNTSLPSLANNSYSERYRIPRKAVASVSVPLLTHDQPDINSTRTTSNKPSSIVTPVSHIGSEQVASHDVDPSSIRLLTKEKARPSLEQERYVRWGIAWANPFLIGLWTFFGIGLAIGHHCYYQSLNGTKAGSSAQQNWAIRFGTAFTLLVVACLRAACDSAYKQYIWTLFKRKPFSLGVLDKLFSLTSDPSAFISWNLLKHAKVAYYVATVCWCIPLAGVAPPATLSVVPGFRNETRPTSLALIDWSSSNFIEFHDGFPHPGPIVSQVANLAAYSMSILPPSPPAANSSFHVQFFGPTLQCSEADSSQKPYFEFYSNALTVRNPELGRLMTVTKSTFEAGDLRWGPTTDFYEDSAMIAEPLMSVYSAFSPMAGYLSWIYSSDYYPNYLPDEYNNWPAEISKNRQLNYSQISAYQQQLWIQTADQAMVCTMGNATFDVWYEFVNSIQTVAEYSITNFKPVWSYPDELTGLLDSYVDPYVAVFLATSSLMNGNVSTTLTNGVYNNSEGKWYFDGNVTIFDSSSRVLQHGLSACEDFVSGYWTGNQAIGIGMDGPVLWQQAASEIYLEWGPYFHRSSPLGNSVFLNISNTLFKKPAWMCRNRTLLRAVEDLANNITISMLSSADLVKENATTVNVLYFSTQNVYAYNSRNLIISYGIGIFFALLCACVGFFALQYNGVAHSTSFSAIIATTRNHEFDAVSLGHSLGALPLEHTSMMVRFGELANKDEMVLDHADGGDNGMRRHIGFGAAENVLNLRKGGKYI